MFYSIKNVLFVFSFLFLAMMGAVQAGTVSPQLPAPKHTASSWEANIGRRLTLAEKMALPIANKLQQKHPELSPTEALDQAVTDGFAIAGMVTGILSLFLFGFVLGLLGIIFSGVALKRIRTSGGTRKGKGMAIAGLVCGLVGFVGWIAVLALMV